MDFFYGILFSAHLGFELDYNPINPYVGVNVTDNIAVGAYYNSEENISTYIGYVTEHVELGLVTGYSTSDIMPMAKFNYKNLFISPVVESITRGGSTTYTPAIIIGFDWRM